MIKDERYLTVKKFLLSGDITEFEDIFRHCPKSVFRDDLKTNSKTMDKLIEKPYKFKLYQLHFLSELIGVDRKIIVDLAWKNYDKELKDNHVNDLREYIYENLRR
jgi:hypothetical protein